MEGNKNVDGRSELSALILGCEAVVTYVPLRTEVSWNAVCSLPETVLVHEIAPRASIDPTQEAARASAYIGKREAAIFIPGRRFDAAGTRHGQGGGWYDRFLANVPKEWLRIGFCYDQQFSSTPLVRESWDQAMDVICVISGNDVAVYRGNRVYPVR